MAIPRCPYCNAQGLKHLAAQEVGYFSVVHCAQCGAIYGVVPNPQYTKQRKSTQSQEPLSEEPQTTRRLNSERDETVLSETRLTETTYVKTEIAKSKEFQISDNLSKKETTPQNTSVPGYLVELGNLDLSIKIPYSPEKMAARAKAAGRGVGSQYLRIVVDNGPPICIDCKIEMLPVTIPPGYPNSGRAVWICPNYEMCREWELAE